MSDNALVPVAQKTIVFYDDEITAVVIDDDGTQSVYVPIRPICENLGVSWPSQSNRINRDPILSDVKGVFMVNTPGGQQQTVCLPLDFLNGWLFKMDAARVKPEIKESLLRYQRECYRILAREFVRPAVTPTPSTSLQQVREMGLAIVRMAEEQMEFDRRLGVTEATVQETAVTVDGLREDVELLKARTDPGKDVTDEQASQISQAVKAVAIVLGKQTGRNEFGGCYGELYRKFGTTSYKKIRASQFDEVMAWLSEWYQTVANEDLPF